LINTDQPCCNQGTTNCLLVILDWQVLFTFTNLLCRRFIIGWTWRWEHQNLWTKHSILRRGGLFQPPAERSADLLP
jgi:hypothetical protein